MSINGKHAVVTEGIGCLGLHIAKELISKGVQVRQKIFNLNPIIYNFFFNFKRKSQLLDNQMKTLNMF